MRAGEVVAGRYRLVEQVGSGGNGVVWRAVDERLDRPVALKRAIPGDGRRYSEQIRELRREARLLAQLNHRNVVTLYDVLDDGGECWLVMEYVPARTMAERGVLSPVEAAHAGAQIAAALVALHAKGMLHRDIKPANILMLDDGEAKLGDFGISQIVAGEETVTGSALLAGTPGYVAPEVARGSDPVPASDIFSLGSTLFAAVEGTSPVGATTDNAFLRIRRAADGTIATARQAGPLGPVLERLLAVDPVRRPTAAEARDLLAEVAGMTLPEPPAAPRRGSRKLVLAGTAMAVVAGLVAWFALSGPPEAKPAQGLVLPETMIMGDPRTADPCPLIPSGPLKRFGEADFVKDVDGFDQCDVILKYDLGEIDTRLKFVAVAKPVKIPGVAENKGGFAVLRGTSAGEYCVNRILLPEGYEIRIDAFRHRQPDFDDLCAVAGAATDYAAEMLARGPIPRRAQPDPSSAIRLDACALESSPGLSDVRGVDFAHPKPGFGNWACTWTGSAYQLKLEFLRRELPEAKNVAKTVQLKDKRAVVFQEKNGSATCEVGMTLYQYEDDFRNLQDDAVFGSVSGGSSQDERCRLAIELMTAWRHR
ncbi:serine/threonine-protein kinase [Amycolatopsis sp. NPDC059657]|uniref:serine/threonine-protein kinase n=1 Tax=Amycolatopsis sp. NPDC059657 TaxID=3346899 RepID=UPI00366D0A9A